MLNVPYCDGDTVGANGSSAIQFDAEGSGDLLMHKVCPPPANMELTPRSISVVRGRSQAKLDVREGSDSSTDTIDGFVAVKPSMYRVQSESSGQQNDNLQKEIYTGSDKNASSIDGFVTVKQANACGKLPATADTNHLQVMEQQNGSSSVHQFSGKEKSTTEDVRLTIDGESIDDDPVYAALLKDQRNSLQMRSQAYASIAVVAALIAGISVTFVVEIDVNPETTDPVNDEFRSILLQFCAVGTLLVCFMSLYGTMVLSMQYYLVTRALGNVSTISLKNEALLLHEVSNFMTKTRWIRHFAVKCVVISVPLFGIVMGAFGVAKNGMGPVAYGAIGSCVVACCFFLHAVYAQNAAFGHHNLSEDLLPTTTPSLKKSDSKSVVFKTVKETFSGEKPIHANLKSPTAARIIKPEHLLYQSKNQASNFRLVW